MVCWNNVYPSICENHHIPILGQIFPRSLSKGKIHFKIVSINWQIAFQITCIDLYFSPLGMEIPVFPLIIITLFLSLPHRPLKSPFQVPYNTHRHLCHHTYHIINLYVCPMPSSVFYFNVSIVSLIFSHSFNLVISKHKIKESVSEDKVIKEMIFLGSIWRLCHINAWIWFKNKVCCFFF